MVKHCELLLKSMKNSLNWNFKFRNRFIWPNIDRTLSISVWMSGGRKRSFLSEDPIYRDLSPTKTVWGLTKEEIEMSAYLFQLLAILIVLIGFLDFFAHSVLTLDKTHWLASFSLFISSIIPMSLGFYGVCKEHIWGLILYLLISAGMFFAYMMVAVYERFPTGMLFVIVLRHFLIGLRWHLALILIMLMLVIQLIISVMLILMLFKHNEIFKKEIKGSDHSSELITG